MSPYVARHPMHGTPKENLLHPLRTFKKLLLPKNRRTLITSIFFTGFLTGVIQMMFAPGRQEVPVSKVSFFEGASAYNSFCHQLDSLKAAKSREEATRLYETLITNAKTAQAGFQAVVDGGPATISAETASMKVWMIDFQLQQADSAAERFGIEIPLQKKAD